MIASHAVDTLPYDIRYFFEANRQYITEHASNARSPGSSREALGISVATVARKQHVADAWLHRQLSANPAAVTGKG